MPFLVRNAARPLRIAVIGSGVSGLSAAWLLSQRHSVFVFEADNRIGGHSNTVDAAGIPVDTGFIVYNEVTYPNLTALFRHLGVATKPSEMSFAVSLDDGDLEYCGTDLAGLFAQPGNLLRPRFWSMLADLRRFYNNAARDAAVLGLATLDDYLAAKNYGQALRDDHLYPMAARDLVHPRRRNRKAPGRVVYPVLRQSRAAPSRRAAGVAHRRWRQPGLHRPAHTTFRRADLHRARRSDGAPTGSRGRDHR